MNKARRNNILVASFVLVLITTAVPALSSAQTTGAINITTCNQMATSPLPSSVGAYGPTASIYVPVSDATVELNTGTTVYETCVLRELVDADRFALTAYYSNNTTQQILTGRTVTQSNGQTTQAAQFIQQQGQSFTTAQATAVASAIQNYLNSLDPNIRSLVQQAIAQGYSVATYQAPSLLACPYAGATSAFTNSNAQFSWNNILAVGSPCNPLFAYIDANDLVTNYAAQEVQCLQNQLLWGGGFYAVTTGSGGPCEQTIVTPSSNVNSLYTQVLQGPYNQLQNANDIGQLVNGAFAGIGERVLASNSGGIAGLEQSTNGAPTLSQIAAQLGSQSTSLAVNDTLDADMQYLSGQYIPAETQIIQSISQATSTLYQQQSSCWQTVLQAVCGTANPPGNSCTTKVQQCTTVDFTLQQSCTMVPGPTVTVATSTNDFAGAAINAPDFYGGQSMQAIYTSAVTNLGSAQQLLQQLNTIYTGLNSTPQSQAALNEYNSLPSAATFQQQAATANQTEQAIQNLLGGQNGSASFITTLTNGWEGQTNNTDANGNPVINSWSGFGSTGKPNGTDTGWCNATSGTVSAWGKAW